MISHKAYFTAKQPEAHGKSFLKDLEIIQPGLIGKTCLWRHFCKMVLCFTFCDTFKVKCPMVFRFKQSCIMLVFIRITIMAVCNRLISYCI